MYEFNEYTCSLLALDPFFFFFFRFISSLKLYGLMSILLSITERLFLLCIVSDSNFDSSWPLSYLPAVAVEYNTSPIDGFIVPSILTTSWLRLIKGREPKMVAKSKVLCMLAVPKYFFDTVCLVKE